MYDMTSRRGGEKGSDPRSFESSVQTGVSKAKLRKGTMCSQSTLVSKGVSRWGDEPTILKLLCVPTTAEQLSKGQQVVGPRSFTVGRKVT